MLLTSKSRSFYMALLLLCVAYRPALAQCKSSLSYLSDQIPSVDDDRLTSLRDQILQTEIADVIAKIREQGLSLEKAAELMLEQSSQYDEAIEKAADGIRQSAQTPEPIIAKLKQRSYRGLVPLEQNVLGSFIGTYIATDWGQLANRETAIQVACYAKQ
jgi:hypothetical protein